MKALILVACLAAQLGVLGVPRACAQYALGDPIPVLTSARGV